MKKNKPVVYAFIDAANLFYGGESSLGWSIDYKKLREYLKTKFAVRKAYYYAGVEINDFPYDPLSAKPIDLRKLLAFHRNKLKDRELSLKKQTEINKYMQRIKFYRNLENFGFILKLKPTKIYHDGDRTIKKANCDVDLTFDLMKFFDNYDGVVILSGDGDFAPVLKYLKNKKKTLHILSRGERTAKELKRLVGSDFMDFHYLREKLKYTKKAPI